MKKESPSPTKVKLTVICDQKMMDAVKQEVLTHLAKDHVKIQGFRSGKAPLSLVEKSVDQNLLQSEFLDSALNRGYVHALDEKELRPIAQPEVSISKFVPFTTLEFTAEVEVIGDVKLPDYKKVKVTRKKVEITDKDVNEVIDTLKARVAEKTDVDRAAKDGDEVTIDFAGTDAKTKEPISGADGKGYPLLLGSNSFIPGFESNLVGMKKDETKSFDLTFPKDYGVAALQSRKVTFEVTVQKIQELVEPKLDADFAAKIGPFKSMADLKTDIKKQVKAERESQAERDFQNELLSKIAEKTEVAIPGALVESEIDRMEQEERQNLVYRGQTWQEHLDAEGVTEEQHRENQREMATMRVKSGLMLAEVAKQEKVVVSAEEIEQQMEALKTQYTDQAMQAELSKPGARQEIASRLVSEKTIKILEKYAA
ncbi:trigger factor [Candidatus Saccharibacteria bacterium]|nr:trigger factor [Candidatus Saccharibacteria bacterium]